MLNILRLRVPDNAKIKLKMVHAGSKDTLRKALDGIAAEVQATDYDEVDFNSESASHQPLSIRSRPPVAFFITAPSRSCQG